MKLGIIINTNDPETAWNALRLANEAVSGGNIVKIFLLGSGVEIEDIKDETFNVAGMMKVFTRGKGNIFGCGTCMGMRRRLAGVVLKSTLPELLQLIGESDRVVSFG